MNRLNIKLPTNFVDPGHFGLDAKPLSIKRWLDELPLANVTQSSDEVLALLHEMNQSAYQPELRYNLLATIQPTMHKLNDSLRTHYNSASQPLSPKLLVKQQLSCNLNNELALGYRIIVDRLNEQRKTSGALNKHEVRLLMSNIYLAIQHLSEVLIENYLAYAPAPQRVWGEINSLFSLAERQELTNQIIAHSENRSICLSISSLYKSTLLLALCSPYHLMNGDIARLQQILCKGAQLAILRGSPIEPACKSCASHECHNCFIIDIQRDSAPRFNPGKMKPANIQTREIIIKPVISWMRSLFRRAQGVQKTTSSKGDLHLTLSDRMYRDMLGRILNTISRVSDRSHKRNAILGKIDLTLGLSASHYHISDEAPFQPEKDEIQLHTGKQDNSRDQFSLIPIEDEPWRDDEDEQIIEDESRESHFDDQDSALDMWVKVYSTNNRFIEQDAHNHDMKKHIANSSWTQKNISDGGMCIFCQPDSPLAVHVGDIASYSKERNDTWALGIIRWLKVHENQILEIGIMHLVNEAWSCAARSIMGTGKGCEYFRCLITDIDINSEHTSIIVPTAVFDAGSTLVLSFNNEIYYITLDEQLLTTKSITHFRFSLTERPDIESEQINTLRRML